MPDWVVWIVLVDVIFGIGQKVEFIIPEGNKKNQSMLAHFIRRKKKIKKKQPERTFVKFDYEKSATLIFHL